MAEQYASLLWRRTPLLCERFELIFLEPACSPIEQQGVMSLPVLFLFFQTNGNPRMVLHQYHLEHYAIRGYQKTPIFEIHLIPYLIPFLWS